MQNGTPQPLVGAAASTLDGGTGPSLTQNSAARFAYIVGSLVLGLVTGLVTARSLGPAGKGLLTALALIAALLTRVAGLGLAEAAAIVRARTDMQLDSFLAATFAPVTIACALAVGVLVGIGYLAGWNEITSAVALQAVAMVLAAYSALLVSVVNAIERFKTSSVLLIVRDLVAVGGTILLVAGLGMGISGAVAAALIAEVAFLALALRRVARLGFDLRPLWRPDLVRKIVRIGFAIQSAGLLAIVVQRIDQLIVLQLEGAAAAGYYSVALSFAQVAAYGAAAVATATFPRVAVAGSDATSLALRSVRLGTLASIGLAMLLGAIGPVALPLLYGRGFQPAVAPALLLLIGAVLYGVQFSIARSAAALQRPQVMVFSAAVNAVAMIGLDYVLIRPLGIRGAALAAILASWVGVLAAVAGYRRYVGPLKASQVVPTRGDLLVMIDAFKSLSRRVRAREDAKH